MDKEFKTELDKIDQQAFDYYNRFTGYKPPDLPNLPIVYFDKLYAITRSDFISYPLLSIPLYDYDPQNPVRWQSSLGHELGHYIYWNSLKYSKYSEAHENFRQTVIQALVRFWYPDEQLRGHQKSNQPSGRMACMD